MLPACRLVIILPSPPPGFPCPCPTPSPPQPRLAANALWLLPSALAHSLFVNVRVGDSPSALPLPLRCPCYCVLLLLLLLFAFCQNGNEENLHGRCICGIFPSGRRVRRDGRGRLGVRMSFLIISVFAFFAFALFLLHLCTLSPPLLPSLSHSLCFPFPVCPPAVICLAFLCVFQKVLCKSCASPALICCVQPFEMRQLFAQLSNTGVSVVCVSVGVSVSVSVAALAAATCSSFIMLTL